MFENVTRDLGNGRGQVTCAQLLAALEGVCDDDPAASGPPGAQSPHSSGFDSISVQHPSASISAGVGGTRGRVDRDSSGVAAALSPPATLYQATSSPDSSRATSEREQQYVQLVSATAGVGPAAEAASESGTPGPHGSAPPPQPMMQGSLPSAAFTATSLFSPERESRRSGSWSLSDAESMPAMPAAGNGLTARVSPQPVLAVDNVTFEMGQLSDSESAPASDDGVTISGVVPGTTAAAATGSGSVGLASGSRSATWARSHGLSATASRDFSQRTDTSALVDSQIMRGTMEGFLGSTGGGRGLGESVEQGQVRDAAWRWPHGACAASVAGASRSPLRAVYLQVRPSVVASLAHTVRKYLPVRDVWPRVRTVNPHTSRP